MGRARVQSCVSEVVPCRHMAWPKDAAPPLPWAVFYGERTILAADGDTYSINHRWTVELYQQHADGELERRMLDALRAEFGPVQPSGETWIDSENCLMTVYRFAEIERI